MYYRKQGDAKRRQRLLDLPDYPRPWYFDERKKRWVRFYQGSDYTYEKRYARRHNRRIANRTGIYSKHYTDLWWNVW